MTSNFFKILILNSLLLRFSASFDQLIDVSGNNLKAAATCNKPIWSSEGLRTHRVVGEKADAKDFAFLGSVVLDDDLLHVYSSCGGTIVSRWHLLTSAQCICDLNPICPKIKANLLYVIVGTTYRWNPNNDAVYHSIDEIIMHPEFHKNDYNYQHDLAMIKIKGAFSLNDKLQIIKLPDLNMKDNIIWMENSGAQCTVFGWNTVSALYITGMFKNKFIHLNYNKLNLQKLWPCLEKWGKTEYFKFRYHVCAEGSGDDYCTGDKGSGLICGTGDYRYILGVASMTHDCCYGCFRTNITKIEKHAYAASLYYEIGCLNCHMPIIFTRVDQNLEFIKKIIDFSDEKTKSAKSSGYFIHSQFVTKYYCTSLISVLILTLKTNFRKCLLLEFDLFI